MKILLLSPPRGLWMYWKEKFADFYFTQLGAYLEKEGFEVVALDSHALDHTWDEMEEEIRKARPDAVIQCPMTRFAENALYAFKRARKAAPHALMVAGGLHFTYLAEEECGNPAFDVIIRGEPELTAAEFFSRWRELPDLSADIYRNIRGIAYVHPVTGEKIITPERELIENLDTLPMPAYHLFPMDRYNFFGTLHNWNRIYTSRGCNQRCTFCYRWRFYGGKYRYRSGKLVADELELLNKKFGIKYVEFWDDNFNLTRERMLDFVEAIKDRDWDIQFQMYMRADHLLRDKDCLPALKAKGLYCVLIGIERATDEELRAVRKNLTVDKQREAFRILRELGIASVGTALIGFREDTEESMLFMAERLEELDPDSICLMIPNPLPGSDLFNKLKGSPIFDFKSYNRLNQLTPIWPTETVSRERIKEIYNEILRRFLSNEKRKYRVLNERGAWRHYAANLYDNIDYHAKLILEEKATIEDERTRIPDE